MQVHRGSRRVGYACLVRRHELAPKDVQEPAVHRRLVRAARRRPAATSDSHVLMCCACLTVCGDSISHSLWRQHIAHNTTISTLAHAWAEGPHPPGEMTCIQLSLRGEYMKTSL